MATAEDSAGLVLGIDGGGSRCTAVVAREARAFDAAPAILGRGHAGPANPRVAGHDAACQAIADAIRAAFADAGLAQEATAVACLGLAGVGVPADRDAIYGWAERAGIGRRVIVVPDGLVLFGDAGAEPWGIVLIAGTGSLALARPRGALLGAVDAAAGGAAASGTRVRIISRTRLTLGWPPAAGGGACRKDPMVGETWLLRRLRRLVLQRLVS